MNCRGGFSNCRAPIRKCRARFLFCRVLPRCLVLRFLARWGCLPRLPRFAAIHAFVLLILGVCLPPSRRLAFVERVLPRNTLSRFLIRPGYLPRSPRSAAMLGFAPSFYGGVYPGRRRARPSALRLGPHGLPALQTQRQVPPAPQNCRGARFREPPRHAPQTTDRAARAIPETSLMVSDPRLLWARDRFSRPARSVPAASLQRPFGEGIA